MPWTIWIAALFALHSLALVAVVFIIRRELRSVRDELATMRAALDEALSRRAQPAKRKRAMAGAYVDVEDEADVENVVRPLRLGAGPKLWPTQPAPANTDRRVGAEALRALAVTLLMAAPAAPLMFGAPLFVSAASVAIATIAALGLASQKLWRPAAWIAAFAATAWTLAALVVGAAQAAPIASACAAVVMAGGGLAFARLQTRSGPGLALAATMGVGVCLAVLNTDIASAHGAALAAIVALAAITGASSPKLEFVHVAAFFAACCGVAWLSGSESAAIWMAPACALSGALFLALASVAAPMRGAQGLLVAATGAVAPIIGAWSLHETENGLTASLSAAAAFAAIAIALGAILAVAARRAGKIADLGWTAWVLGIAAISAGASALAHAANPPLLAALTGLFALGLGWLDTRVRHGVWRAGAAAMLLATAALSIVAGAQFIAAAPGLNPLAIVAVGVAAPAMFALAGSRILRRRAPATAGLFEGFAWLAGAATFAALARLVFSAGAVRIAPIGFAEAGLLGAAALGLSLFAAVYMHRQPRRLRNTAAALFAGAGLATCLVGAAFLFNPWWGVKTSVVAGLPVLNQLVLGYALAGAVGTAHFVFWRARGRKLFARASLVFAAAMLALWAALELRRAFSGPALDLAPLTPMEAAGYALIAGAAIGAAVLHWPLRRVQLPQQA